jgi:hypothetical protein
MSGSRFFAHSDAEGRHRAHAVQAANAMEAALAFAESWLPLEAGAGEVRVIVEDCETGVAQCYVVDLDDLEAEPCPPAAR